MKLPVVRFWTRDVPGTLAHSSSLPREPPLAPWRPAPKSRFRAVLRVKRIGYAGMRTDDVDGMTRFFREVLGLEPVGRTRR